MSVFLIITGLIRDDALLLGAGLAGLAMQIATVTCLLLITRSNH